MPVLPFTVDDIMGVDAQGHCHPANTDQALYDCVNHMVGWNLIYFTVNHRSVLHHGGHLWMKLKQSITG